MTLAAVMQVMVTANTSQATASMGRFQRQMLATEATAVKSQRGVARAFRTGALAAGLIGAASGKMAIEFDKNMRNVNSIAQLPEKQFLKLEERVKALGGPTAQSPRILAEGLYDLVSSGFDANESMKILESSSRAATAGLTTTEIATKAVAAVLNAYRRPASDAAQVSDDLFQTVNLGVVRFDELAQVIGDGLPFAAQMGVNIKALGSAMTTMTRAGLSPAETMTRIKNVLVSMIKPSVALKDAYKELGVASGPELIDKMGGGTVGFQRSLEAIMNTTVSAKDLQQAYHDLGVRGMDELIRKTGSTSEANAELAKQVAVNIPVVGKLFPNIRALGGALALTAGNTKDAEKNLKGFADTSGATDRVFREQAKSVALQWNKTKAMLESTAINIGNNLLPVLNDVMQVMTDPKLSQEEKFTKVFDRLFEAVEKLAPMAIEAGANIAKNIFFGILHSSPPVQILTGLWLFKAFGGFLWVGAMMRGLVAKMWYWLGAALLTSPAVNAVALGFAKVLGSALLYALPIGLAAVGLGNIVMSLVGGDTEAAAYKAGGAISGAIAGGILGGPLGALIGGGLGSLLGGAIEGMLGDTKKIPHMMERLRTSSKGMANALEQQKSAIDAAKESSKGLRRAHAKEDEATKKVKRANEHYHDVLDKYPAKSQKVQEAEAELTIARREANRATKRAEKLEKEHGEVREALKPILRDTLREERNRIIVLKDQHDNLQNTLQQQNEYGASNEELQGTLDKLSRNERQLKEARKGEINTLKEATQRVGPKFAKMIDHMTQQQLEFGKKTTSAARSIENPLKKNILGLETPIIQSSGNIKKLGFAYQDSAQAGSDAIGVLYTNTDRAAKALEINLPPYAAVPVKGGKGEQKKQAGGRLVNGTGIGDKVPLLAEPGEVVWNREAVRAMGGIARVDAINKMIPRFQGGGAVEGGLSFALGPYDIPPIQYDAAHAGGQAHVHISGSPPSWVVGIGHKLQDMGYLVGEHPAFGGVTSSNHAHYGPTDHYHGGAIDVNSAEHLSETRTEVAEIAALLRNGKVAAAVAKINRMIIEGNDGALKDIPQGFSDLIWKGANKYLADHAPHEKFGVSGGGPDVGPGAVSRPEMRALLKAHGMPNWTGWIAMAESLLDPNAVSSAGARGLFQVMPSWGGGDQLFDPNYNVGKARHILTTQGLSAWDPSKYAGAIPEGWGPHQGQPFQKGGKVTIDDIPHLGVPYNPSNANQVSLDKLFPRLGAKKGKKRRKALGSILDKVRDVGLNENTFKRMQELTTEWNLMDENASNAASLNQDTSYQLVKDLNDKINPYRILESTLSGDELTVGSFPSELAARAKLAELLSGSLGRFQGKTEAEWLGSGPAAGALHKIWNLRNVLVNAQSQAVERIGTVNEMLRKAQERFEEVAKFVREVEKKLHHNEHLQDVNEKDRQDNDRKQEKVKKDIDDAKSKLDAELAKPKKKQRPDFITEQRRKIHGLTGNLDTLRDENKDLRKDRSKLMEHHGDLAIKKSRGVRERDALKDKVIPAMTDKIQSLSELSANILGGGGEGFDGLGTVQGSGSYPMEVIDKLPELGTFGGEIFRIQNELKNLGADTNVVSDVTDTGSSAVTGMNISDLLQFAEAVSLGAFKTQPVQVPGFARGGIPKGLAWVGENGPELYDFGNNSHGGRVYSNRRSEGMSGGFGDLKLELSIGGEKIDERIDVKLKDENDKELARWRQG